MFLWLWIFVQIIGESLPISSSGHVELLQKLSIWFPALINMQQPLNSTTISMIDFLLHGPTIIILLIYFFATWWQMVFKVAPYKIVFARLMRPVIFIIIADGITIFFWASKIVQVSSIQIYFLPIGFCITMFCLYISSLSNTSKKLNWSWSDAIFLGSVQAVSLMPGISRFAATYAAGIRLGYRRQDAFALSFFIQIPLLCAGFLKGIVTLQSYPDIIIDCMQFWTILCIVVASWISYKLFCLVAVLIEQNKLWYFAGYMMIPIVISIL